MTKLLYKEKQGNKRILHFFGIKISYKENKVFNKYAFCSIRAFIHAMHFFFIQLFHKDFVTINGIELSNCCNLKCPNCCTPTTKYKKGFADEKTVKKAFKYMAPGSYCSFHRLGEPLLHKDFLKYLKKGRNLGFRTCVSTNGTLLTKDIAKEIIKAKPTYIMVSLHQKKSVEAYMMLFEELKKANWMPESFSSNMLSHNKEDVLRWLDELSASDEVRAYVRDLQSHSWAGNVEEKRQTYDNETVERRIQNCHFIKNNIANVRWDGTIVACCLDSENLTQIGHIDDFYSVKHNKNGYEMCRHCDPSWINGEAI